MDNFDISTMVEEQNLTLQKAKSILAEVDRYFTDTIEPDTAAAYQFVKKREHIQLLLISVRDYIWQAISEGDAVVAELGNK